MCFASNRLRRCRCFFACDKWPHYIFDWKQVEHYIILIEFVVHSRDLASQNPMAASINWEFPSISSSARMESFSKRDTHTKKISNWTRTAN